MFNKRTDEAPAPAGAPHTAPLEPPPLPQIQSNPLPPPPPAARHTATIGPAMHINGQIRTDEELLVDGQVEGSVESHHLVTVGVNGKVRANIKARDVVIFGEVQGNIEATGKIAIRDHGSLVGDIITAGISIDDGAYFKGSIDITHSHPKVAHKPVQSELPDRVETPAAV